MASRIQKKRNRLKHSAVMLMLAVILCLSQIPAAVFAEEPNDSENGQLTAAQTGTLTYKTGAEGLTVHIYKVGTVDAQGKTKLDAAYDKYQLTQNNKTMAGALEGYLERDKVIPLQTKTSEASGEDYIVRFENLEQGWYLLTGDVATVNGITYTQNPVLATMPGDSPSGTTWNAVVEGKYGKVTYTKLRVQKIWEDNNSSSRPTSVVVQLLCDGNIQEEVTLSAANNWYYTWEHLEDFTKKWAVVEKSATSSYTVGIEQNKGLVTITNTKPSKNTPDVKPDTDTKIPQTGQLWWPVPILAFAGLLCLVIGLRRRSRN